MYQLPDQPQLPRRPQRASAGTPRARLWATREDGTISVEFLIWLPLVLALSILIFEASAAFMTQANAWRVANHVGRGVATGRMTIAQAETQVQNTVGHPASIEPAQGLLRIDISIPYSQIGAGFLGPWGNMNVSLFHRIEPHVSL